MTNDAPRNGLYPFWLKRFVPLPLLPYRSLMTTFWEGLRLGLISYLSYELLCGAELYLIAEKRYELCVLPDPRMTAVYLGLCSGVCGYVSLRLVFKTVRVSHRRISRCFGFFSGLASIQSALPVSSSIVELLPPEAMALRAVVLHTIFPATTAFMWLFLNAYATFPFLYPFLSSDSFKWLPGLLSFYDDFTVQSHH